MRWCAYLLLAALLPALLAGCGPKPPPIVGAWYDPQNEYVVNFDEQNHKFWATEGPLALTGVWSFDGHKATVTDFAINGKTSQQMYDEQVSQMMGPGHKKEIEELKKTLTPEFELSADGKTLSYFNQISKKPSTMSRLLFKDQ